MTPIIRTGLMTLLRSCLGLTGELQGSGVGPGLSLRSLLRYGETVARVCLNPFSSGIEGVAGPPDPIVNRSKTLPVYCSRRPGNRKTFPALKVKTLLPIFAFCSLSFDSRTSGLHFGYTHMKI